MVKKVLLGMMAFATLFATSCTNELDPVEMGNTSTVSFKVATPAIESRAYSDGATATVLQYAVYDANGNYLSDLTETDATINGSATVNLQLTTGNTYSVIFWAAADGAPYAVNFAEKKMTVDYTNAVSNDENRDAFYKHHTFTVTGAQTETIELKRPFAQLNIGTADFAKSKSAGYVPTYSSVKVSNVYTTLNLVNGDVSIPTTDVTFAPGVIPTAFDATENKFTGEKFPVDGYDYLAMNYLLVGADKGIVDIEFTYGTSVDDPDAKKRTVGSVPVQRNYRTNIYGQLLTSDVDINVEIKPEYDGALELDDLHKAALNGGEYTLTEDIVLTAPLEVKSNLTLNLNGKTISGNHHKSIGAVITNYGTLTITGGTITSAGENGGSAVQNNGTMIITGTTLNGAPNANGSWPSYTVNNTGKLTITDSNITSHHGAVSSYGEGALVLMNNTNIDMSGIPGFTSHGIYTYNNGKVVVDGGEIANKATDQSSSGASVINGTVEVIAGKFSGRIENYYGTPVLKGGSYTVKPNNSFVASGYLAIAAGGLYYVLPEVIAKAATAASVTAVTESTADLATALAANNGEATMFLWNDVAYIAKNNGEILITSAADEATTARGVVEGAAALTSATVAEGIEVVGNRTFRKCANLVTVALPNTLTEIGPAVFQSCSSLTSVTIPAGVTTIGEGAFAECTSLKTINIPTGVTRIEKDALRNTGLETIEFHEGVTYFGTYAFRDCEQLSKVVINAPEFTVESNTFTNMAAPVPSITIYVVNAEMKSYLESKLTNYDKTYITVVAPNTVTNDTELTNAIANKNVNIIVAGEIDLANVTLSGYNGTIIGTEGAVLNTRNFTPSADEAYQLRSQNLTFKNLTIKLPTGGDWLKAGFVGTGKIVFDNCKFEGQATLNGQADWIFNNCEFVSVENGAYSSFVYGAIKATFNGCAFSGVDRAAKVYAAGGTLNVEYNNCTYTSTTLNKAGVEIDATYATTTVALNGCSQSKMNELYALKGTKGTVNVQ